MPGHVIELLRLSRLIKRVALTLREGGVRLVSKSTRVVDERLAMLPAHRALRRQLAATESLDDYGVHEDFRLYASLVRRGGWIAFRDIVPAHVEFRGGVPDFWRR
jgi:hypothetical protein